MNKITVHGWGARWSLIVALLGVAIATNACSGGESEMFRYPISGNGQIEGGLRVSRSDTYSVAIEAVVAPSIQNARQQAWNYLATPDASAPLRITIAIQKDDGTPVFSGDAVDPKLTSWSAEKLYLEVARVELSPGHYRFRFSQTGKDLGQQPSFQANLVIVPAYEGK